MFSRYLHISGRLEGFNQFDSLGQTRWKRLSIVNELLRTYNGSMCNESLESCSSSLQFYLR